MPLAMRNVGSTDCVAHLTYTPRDIASFAAKPPLIIFLHGAGERGTDHRLIIQSGLDSAVEHLQPPAIMVFPQCGTNYRAFYGDMENMVFRVMEDALTKFDGDPQRVYLIGYSMGATSSLYLAARHKRTFAGIVSIAVGITYPWEEWGPPPNLPQDGPTKKLFADMFLEASRVQFIAQEVKDTPIWFIHGEDDEFCPVEESQMLTNELQKLGAQPKLTTYPGVGHDSLINGLHEPGLFDWLLAQKRI